MSQAIGISHTVTSGRAVRKGVGGTPTRDSTDRHVHFGGGRYGA